MGQVLQKFELMGADASRGVKAQSKPGAITPTINPLLPPDLWITVEEVATLADVHVQTVHKKIANRKWRGTPLLFKSVASTTGRGGKMLMLHVDHLPDDLRERWYAQHGIKLHEKVDPETGEVRHVPDENFQHDADFEERHRLAEWRRDLIDPVTRLPKGSADRAALIKALAEVPHRFPNGERKAVTPQTLYNWVKAYESDGVYGLMRKRRSDTGAKRTGITRAWDGFFAPHIDETTHNDVADEITRYIRSLWGAGERGWRSISEKSTTKLIELSRDLRVVAFDALELGRCGDTARAGTQFGLCHINRRMIEKHREYKIIAVQAKDNATFQDRYMPSVRRDYDGHLPREIVVGDVHPVDIMMRRPDGTVVYPKAIAWYDVATNEMHMTFVLLEPKEGIRREHVAQSFQAMVEEWGLPQMLYLDNGSEYSWDAMIGGFTQLSKLTGGGIKVFDLDGNPEVAARVAEGREAVARSRPYNAKGKLGIEGAFGNLEQVFFATIPGWTAGDRMAKKTHAKGKDPIAFPGDARAFLDEAGRALDWYHKRPQHGKLKGQSPNEALRGFIDQGWGKTVLSRPEVLALAFAEVVERVPDRGRVSYTPRRGETLYFYHDDLLGIDRRITLRVPAFNPEFVFCFDGDELICQAFPERAFGVFDPRGAEEVNRRGKAFRRQIAEKKRHVALLSLTEETERHIAHMPDAPEAPVAAVVDAGIIDRMARLAGEERKQALAEAEDRKKRKAAQQWKTGPVKALENFKFAEEEHDD